MSVGIIGIGVVGTAMFKSFQLSGVKCYYYDKFAPPFVDTEMSSRAFLCEKCSIIFLALPTPLNRCGIYDLNAIHVSLSFLEDHLYNGIVVIKSTILPRTTNTLSDQYKTLHIVHIPEFLTSRTAFDDFHNQDKISIGLTASCTEFDIDSLTYFFKTYYPCQQMYFYTATETLL